MSELLAASGLDIDRSSLSRKLRGDQPMTTEECECLCRALALKVSYQGRAA